MSSNINTSREMTTLFVKDGGGDLVILADRIAVASSLCALGIPSVELSEDMDVAMIDQIATWSVDMVKLVALLRGLGPRSYGVSVYELVRVHLGLSSALISIAS
jgi:hypothetical protein